MNSAQGDTAGPTPSRRGMNTLTDVRREMSRVYRDMRKDKIRTQDGTRLVYVLSMIGKIIESSDLQNRLEALEAKLAQSR
jgi:hypothetical protein